MTRLLRFTLLLIWVGVMFVPHTASQANTSPAVVITITQPGVQIISQAALAAAGFPVETVNPEFLQLTQAGEPIAMDWYGNADSQFTADEFFLFYAPMRYNRYTAVDGYTLTIGDQPGLRMQTRSANPAGLPVNHPTFTNHFEQNLIYGRFSCSCSPPPTANLDPWFWRLMVGSDATYGSFSHPFSLNNLAPNTPAKLTLRLVGSPNMPNWIPNHQVVVNLNGHGLGSYTFSRITSATITISLSAGQLVNGSNQITFTANQSGFDQFWLDSFTLEYSRSATPNIGQLTFVGQAVPSQYQLNKPNGAVVYAFDVSTANTPIRLTDTLDTGTMIAIGETTFGEYPHVVYLPLVTSATTGGSNPNNPVFNPGNTYTLATAGSLRQPTLRLRAPLPGNQDHHWLAFSPAAFTPGLTPLVNLRASQGLNPLVVDLQTIYDHFDDGRPTPHAIRAYLEQAYHTWTTPPEYVVLVGDASYDPRRHLVTSPITYVPPFFKLSPEGEVTSDNQYVNLVGNLLPEMHIGRLPVNSLAETQTVVNKIVGYETGGLQSWQMGAYFVSAAADSSAGNFPANNANLAAQIPTPYTTNQLTYTGDINAMRGNLFNAWNNGQGLLVFNGHSSWIQWAAQLTPTFEDLFDIYFLPDLDQINNGDRLPIVISLSCFTGAYHFSHPEFYPGYGPINATMDESLLRKPDGGAVAVWGSVGLSSAFGYQWMAEGFISNLYQSGEPILGHNVYAGQQQMLTAHAAYGHLIDLFHLFGDPAMHIPFAE